MADTHGWWESRTGIGQWVRTTVHEDIPGGARFTYTLGSVTLLTFMTLCLTGIVQLMYYVPSIQQAYDSVNFLRFEVPLGWLVHGTHFWAANLMVVLVIVHLAQVFIWGAYKAPRELVWVLGGLLLIFTLGAVFTGGPLIWDEQGYWAARVGSGIAGSLPVIGGWLKLWVFGGPTVGQLTLSRFFMLHVALMPILIAIVLGLHVATFRHAGSAGSWDPEANAARVGDFWPRQVLMDLLAFVVALTAVVVAASTWFTPVTGPADAIDATYVARPDWPFLWLFQTLKMMPSGLEVVGTVVVPLVLFGLLFAVPWLGRGESRAPARRPIALAVFVLVIVGLGWLTWLGAQATPAPATPPAGPPPRTPASAISTAPAVPGPTLASTTVGGTEHGKGLFIAYCQECHGVSGKGGVSNPGSADGTVPELNPMDPGIKGKTVDTFVSGIDDVIQNGSAPDQKGPVPPKYVMPSFGKSYVLTQQQIADIEAYVLAFNGVARGSITNPGIRPATVRTASVAGGAIVLAVGLLALFMGPGRKE